MKPRVGASSLRRQTSRSNDLAAAARGNPSAPPEHDIRHVVAEFQAAALELGQWSVVWPRRVAFSRVGEPRLAPEYVEDLLGVVLPVGRDVNVRTGLHPLAQHRY